MITDRFGQIQSEDAFFEILFQVDIWSLGMILIYLILVSKIILKGLQSYVDNIVSTKLCFSPLILS